MQCSGVNEKGAELVEGVGEKEWGGGALGGTALAAGRRRHSLNLTCCCGICDRFSSELFQFKRDFSHIRAIITGQKYDSSVCRHLLHIFGLIIGKFARLFYAFRRVFSRHPPVVSFIKCRPDVSHSQIC